MFTKKNTTNRLLKLVTKFVLFSINAYRQTPKYIPANIFLYAHHLLIWIELNITCTDMNSCFGRSDPKSNLQRIFHLLFCVIWWKLWCMHYSNDSIDGSSCGSSFVFPATLSTGKQGFVYVNLWLKLNRFATYVMCHYRARSLGDD